MSYQLRLFFTALCFFTRLPFIRWAGSSENELNHAVRYFPLVGIIVGLFAAASFWGCALVLPQNLAILLSMTCTLLVTGAFHEDGLADSVDGLGGGWSKEQILNIMKDSRIGSYGAVALVMILMGKFQALTAINSALTPTALIAGHAVSRLAAVWVIASQDYVRETGKAKPLAQQITRSELLIASIFGLAPLTLLPINYSAALIPVVVVWLSFSRKLSQQIGGYTGDCLGAMQQLSEVAFYFGIVICSSI
jgi:adenosylcobinamide-GDP ribazoletransferase